jgi:2-polyprenyl-6-methoxyphenol hydroxylase-like FAD-dependent oxidoreductase
VTGPPAERADVVIVGAGPAGLTAARYLRAAGVPSVLVLEREAQPGGIPRHSDHLGYGLRDLRTVLSGPAYARRLAELADAAGADIRLATTVTGWAADRSLLVTSPQGRRRIDTRTVVLATGARERPRSARLVPGDRPDGVFTTGPSPGWLPGFSAPARFPRPGVTRRCGPASTGPSRASPSGRAAGSSPSAGCPGRSRPAAYPGSPGTCSPRSIPTRVTS